MSYHLKEVIQKGFWAMLIKGSAAGLSFLFTVLVTRALGANESGLFFLSFSMINILAVLGRFGLDNTVLRFSAIHFSQHNWKQLSGLLNTSGIILSLGSVIVTIFLFVSSDWFAMTVFHKSGLSEYFTWMSFAIAPLAFTFFFAQILKGFNKIQASLFVQSAIQPLTAIILLLLMAYGGSQISIVPAFVVSHYCAMTVGLFLVCYQIKNTWIQNSLYSLREITTSCIPLFWVSCYRLVILWSAPIILGIFHDSESVALFSAANNASMLIGLFLVAANSVLAPIMARLNNVNNIPALKEITQKSTLLIAVSSAPLVLPFWAAPGWLMNLFGDSFHQGASILVVLAVGQYVSVISGPVNTLLTMCGFEQSVKRSSEIGVFVNIALCFLLIPPLGIMGAAAASCITLVVQNLICVLFVKQKMGFWTFYFN